MSKYDDFNLDLSKVTYNEKDSTAKAGSSIECQIITNISKISLKVCSKTTEGKGCDPSYTKISPCNRTYNL